jgi:hypothetical protein
VRKIISILVALGLVLGVSVMATPVAADVTEPEVDLSNYCACAAAGYNISFNTSASLTEGVHSVCIEFPDGTTVPAVFEAGDILFNSKAVFVSEIMVSGNVVCFLTPEDFAAGPQLVEFVLGAGIKNPCVAGPYNLYVWTDRAPDATPVKSAAYNIIPAVSIYGWWLDFGPTYPGIAPEFVPPFKACGQNMSTTTYNSSIPGFLEPFDLTFLSTTVGCATPCTAAEIYFKLMAVPEGGVVTLNISDTWFTLDATDVGVKQVLAASYNLSVNMTLVWASEVHFNTKGDYQICFYVECPETNGCNPEAEEIIAERCVDFKVYQWKDAAKITLDEKWNLISLPLVPLVDPPVEDTLASIPAADRAKIMSIWNYDRCTDTWATWGNGQSSLTELVDGKAYWMRLEYPLGTDCGNITWWVWGTEKPMPPASPAEYPVCTGWNMFGFLSTADMDVDDYLWNFASTPVVYGWDHGCWTLQDWNLIASGDDLVVGQGYWGAFTANGAIYVP